MMTLTALASMGSLVTDATNHGDRDLNDRKQLGRRWQTMASLLRSEAFAKVPASAAVWMKDSSISGTEKGDAEYWQYVVAAKTGKDVTFTPDLRTALAAPGGGLLPVCLR